MYQTKEKKTVPNLAESLHSNVTRKLQENL